MEAGDNSLMSNEVYMITPVSPRFLKQQARILKKSNNLILAKALDEVSKNYGFSNYRHFINVYKSNQKRSKISIEVFLERLLLEHDSSNKLTLAMSYIQSAKCHFSDLLEILKQFQHSSKDLQTICEQQSLMKKEIQSFIFEDFLTGEGDYELNFRSPHTKPKQISLSNLTYEIDESILVVEGNYLLKANFEFAASDNDRCNENHQYPDFEYDGSFEIEVDRYKLITFRHSDMSMYDKSTPIGGFTIDEIEEYYTRFPDERGRYDDMVSMDDFD